MLFSCKLDLPNPFINKNFGAEPVILSQAPLPISEVNGHKAQFKMEALVSRRDAISVRNAFKQYGKGDNGTPVLTGVTLTVKEGTIYTILGSSGCGKTTLLNCMVGLTKLDTGECRIFGFAPGTRESGVPGKRVGYMPQEIALYGEFTIKEAMLYFGRIYGMTNLQVNTRMTFLIHFLHLPPSHRVIRSLSGGQQRRVSFAVALLHEPQILILDEPTVGVDPVLRKSIWKHLTELVETGRTTVIITTHYIEEANEAHCIGLLRNGRLLAEDSPQKLLTDFQCEKLEDVFLKLSVRDEDEVNLERSSNGSLRSITASATGDAENANEDVTTPSSLETDVSGATNTVAVCNEKSSNTRKVSVASTIASPKLARATSDDDQPAIPSEPTETSSVASTSSQIDLQNDDTVDDKEEETTESSEDCETVLQNSNDLQITSNLQDSKISNDLQAASIPVALQVSEDHHPDDYQISPSPILSEKEENRSISPEDQDVIERAITPQSHRVLPDAPSPTTPVFNRSVEQLIDAEEVDNSGEDNNNTNNKQQKNALFQPKIPEGQRNDTTDAQPAYDKDRERFERFNFNAMYNRMLALLIKNFVCMWRNIGFVLFIYLLPAIQAMLFCVAIGGAPTNLPLGIINYEVSDVPCNYTPGCSISNMSCNFLKLIPNKTIRQIPYTDERTALEDVRQGYIWGFLVIPKNFSDAMVAKGLSGGEIHASGHFYESGFEGVNVKLYLDLTSQQISFTIQQALTNTFQRLTANLMFACGLNETNNEPNTTIAEPIYGSTDANFREFMAPGIILSIIFFMSVALTGSAFISERKEGMLNRTLVAGVSTGEIIFAHLLTQYVTMIIQTLLVLAVMVWVFEVKIMGSIYTVILLTLFQGTCGMAFGFLISCVCTDERNAIQMALGSFYPNLLLSGVVWPLESIPIVMRQFAYFLPQTMACEAMRSIFSRAWPIDHIKVWPGFAVSAFWSCVFWITALGLARNYRKT